MQLKLFHLVLEIVPFQLVVTLVLVIPLKHSVCALMIVPFQLVETLVLVIPPKHSICALTIAETLVLVLNSSETHDLCPHDASLQLVEDLCLY
jgi:hypothetical protein